MKIGYKYLVILLVVMFCLDMTGKSYYNSASNNFGGLYPHPGMRMGGRYKTIDDGLLVEENATAATAITIDTMTVNSPTYRYQLRIANLNNKQGKTRTIKDPMTGAKTTINGSEWGLVFNRDDNGNYLAVVLKCDNSAPFDDITDERSMLVSLIQCDNGKNKLIAQETISKDVSLEDGMNTICVDVDDRSVCVSIGKDGLRHVLESSINQPTSHCNVGYLIGPGARVAIERSVLTINNEKTIGSATTQWTQEALDAHLAQSTDPMEGYWKYLDRDMQDEWLRLGGRYTIAVVKAEDGYDLIYMQGAEVKKSLWHPGMLKGHITKTAFTDNYDAMWIDATMEPFDKDVYSSIENGIILTLNFPVYRSQIRFAKVVDLDD